MKEEQEESPKKVTLSENYKKKIMRETIQICEEVNFVLSLLFSLLILCVVNSFILFIYTGDKGYWIG